MLADSQEIIMDLLTIENGELRLNSNLDEYTFGKTGHDAILSQEGALFDGKNFRQWTFEEVKSYDAEKNGSKERLVFYCVKNPLSNKAKTLSSFYEEGGDTCFAAVKAVCAALCEAAKNNNSIPSVGPGGILVDGDKAGAKSRNEYISMFGELVQEHIRLYNDFVPEIGSVMMEDIFSEEEKLTITKRFNPSATSFNKSAFNTAIQEALIKRERIELSEDTISRFDQLLDGLEQYAF